MSLDIKIIITVGDLEVLNTLFGFFFSPQGARWEKDGIIKQRVLILIELNYSSQ